MNNNQLNYKKFKKLASQGIKTIPVYKRILSDMLTPVAAWVHLSQNSDYAFIFESVDKGTQYSRYSYVGINPQKILKHKDGITTIIDDISTENSNTPFLDLIRNIQNKYDSKRLENMPPFTGGLVGYLSYENITWFEDIPIHKQRYVDIPDSFFMLYEDLIAFDHLNGDAIVISNVNLSSTDDLLIKYTSACERIDMIGNSLHNKIEYEIPSQNKKFDVKSNFEIDDYLDAVKKAKTHIINGEIFQVVLSQRFERKTEADPYNIYRAVRRINPSPYMFHLKLKNFDVIGASPELMVKVQDKVVEIRPIAGTRKRGKNKVEDKKLADDLLNDEKEKAEHLMLLDLGRNDVGKVCKYGTVEVFENMNIENYSHVMHIVSDVKGILDDKYDVFDALVSGFPAGTVSGAPKIRAMEIINELEPDRRGIYSGTVGFLDFEGNMNTCIAIRTMIVKNKIVYFQSGAGIVHDSDPNSEYTETVNKAKVIMSAIDLAEDGLL